VLGALLGELLEAVDVTAPRRDRQAVALALGQDRVAIVQQRIGIGQPHVPQLRIAEGDDGALAGRVDHDGRDRRHQVAHVHEMAGVDALMRHLIEDVAARCLPGIADRTADRGPAAEPHDADSRIQRIAAANLLEMRGILLGAARGHAGRAEGQISHRHADAEDPRRDFGRPDLKVHAWIRHVR